MLSSPPKTTPAQAPAPAIVKRRRKSGKGQGESSREASAESNDETATDNDPMADDTDTASMSSPRNARNSSRNRAAFEESHHTLAPPHRHKRPPTLATTATINNSIPLLGKEESALRLSSSGVNPQTGLESGLDSSTSTYDGDVSSAPGPADKRGHTTIKHPQAVQSDDLSTQSIKTGSGPGSSMNWAHENSNQQAGLTSKASPASSLKPANPNLPPAPHGILSRIAPEDLQAEMKEAIQNSSKQRSYPINPPPTDRPVRIYADGVYGQSIPLWTCLTTPPMQAILPECISDGRSMLRRASPEVQSLTSLTSAERYESVANCKWVDQVVEDAPWQVDAAFLEKHQIDYVAHDEEPYVSLNSDDVYAYAKSIGKFLPTRRTDGVSTSELLQRIVGGYIEGTYDNKLEKIGAGDLCSNIAFSDAGSGVHRGAGSRTPMVPRSPVHHSTTDAEMDDGTRTASTVLDPVQ
ncbi:hypothetical protein H4Q26_015257 [Puccinia striiformis f. sp. tritici PST-130]|nr:hypothetical protein H4Q26_015257 [Puccinia striiformis f. sp. tritici PST-130]